MVLKTNYHRYKFMKEMRRIFCHQQCMYADGVYVTPKLTGMQLHSQELIFHKP